MRVGSSRGAAALAVALSVWVAGCGAGEKGGTPDGGKDTGPSRTAEKTTEPTEEQPRQLVAHDPPLMFGLASGAPLNRFGVGAVALDGRKAYTYASGHGRIEVVDLASGESVGRGAGPKGTLPETYGEDALEKKAPVCERKRPGVGTVGGKRLAVGVFPTVTKGTGTTADTSTFELVAVDTASGLAALQVPLDVPVSGDSCEVTGVSDSTAVLVLGGNLGPATTYGIDLATGRRVWDRPDFEATLVQRGKVVGKDHAGGEKTARALDAATGQELWRSKGLTSGATIRPFSPDLVHIAEDSAYGGDQVLGIADGNPREVEGFGRRLHQVEKCVYDEKASTFCFARTTKGGELAGYDAVSGKLLWTVGGPSEQEGREAPLLLTAFHGAVYGQLLSDGRPGDPIVLDGGTGKDRELSPGAAPLLVNEYAALTSRGWYTTTG
ncbi:PQQ-binding-like beta-propeller repeat protein [Streptomyces sp. NPDC048606]|uniref:outer membrane protein assembly factor BamB family protein n=1 Tax=Streptomyces sp. NPDC048606 TaxID=3154726 RepID=UPI0034444C6E